MNNSLWHLYYSGTDIVDQNKEWRDNALGKTLCRTCGNCIPGHTACADLVIDQKIPKSADMFSTGYLSPIIISSRLHSRISEISDAYLIFGKIYLSGQQASLNTHCSATGKTPWIALYGNKPTILDGKPVLDPHDRICTDCGATFGRGRGDKYIRAAHLDIQDVSWTDFGGLLIKDHVMQLLSDMKLKNVRIEKVEVR